MTDFNKIITDTAKMLRDAADAVEKYGPVVSDIMGKPGGPTVKKNKSEAMHERALRIMREENTAKWGSDQFATMDPKKVYSWFATRVNHGGKTSVTSEELAEFIKVYMR